MARINVAIIRSCTPRIYWNFKHKNSLVRVRKKMFWFKRPLENLVLPVKVKRTLALKKSQSHLVKLSQNLGASSGRTRQRHEVFKWCSATQHSPLLQINGKWLLLVEHRQRGEHGLCLSWQETKQDTAWIMAVGPQCLTLDGWPAAMSFRLFVETAALITWSLYLAHPSFHFLCSCTPFFMVYFQPLGDIFK